jgi:hypothetical protein
MLNMADRESRIFVGVRLKPDSVERIAAAALALGVKRSEVLRRALAAGLPSVEVEAKRASARRAVKGEGHELST